MVEAVANPAVVPLHYPFVAGPTFPFGCSTKVHGIHSASMIGFDGDDGEDQLNAFHAEDYVKEHRDLGKSGFGGYRQKEAGNWTVTSVTGCNWGKFGNCEIGKGILKPIPIDAVFFRSDDEH